uniref:peptidylprolyl isomerase n=1 Tax=Odontella aurita TaxID=265563 RepID=A0A7S4JTA0_9STRA|mmetsp:Transcript_53756/g.160917  ORF Transcript_53756/g.160917 Transcript_53756/m.160917 type:complete len:245 (+) Transcript_53756:215-949(+)
MRSSMAVSAFLMSLLSLSRVGAFAPAFAPSSRGAARLFSSSNDAEEWINLTEDGAVKKRVIEEGDGSSVDRGDAVVVEYTGKVAERSWSVDDVISCWLSEQQGIEKPRLIEALFVEFGIDGEKITDKKFFTEQFVKTGLGIDRAIANKNIVMGARRLSEEAKEHPAGKVFDSSKDRGAFKFTLGKKQAIQAMELAVLSMNKGEKCQIITRSDYAYGKGGIKKVGGKAILPPFASVQFDIALLHE